MPVMDELKIDLSDFKRVITEMVDNLENDIRYQLFPKEKKLIEELIDKIFHCNDFEDKLYNIVKDNYKLKSKSRKELVDELLKHIKVDL